MESLKAAILDFGVFYAVIPGRKIILTQLND